MFHFQRMEKETSPFEPKLHLCISLLAPCNQLSRGFAKINLPNKINKLNSAMLMVYYTGDYFRQI